MLGVIDYCFAVNWLDLGGSRAKFFMLCMKQDPNAPENESTVTKIWGSCGTMKPDPHLDTHCELNPQIVGIIFACMLIQLSAPWEVYAPCTANLIQTNREVDGRSTIPDLPSIRFPP